MPFSILSTVYIVLYTPVGIDQTVSYRKEDIKERDKIGRYTKGEGKFFLQPFTKHMGKPKYHTYLVCMAHIRIESVLTDIPFHPHLLERYLQHLIELP